MDFIKKSTLGLGLFSVLLLTSSCQISYLLKSAYNQMSLLNQRVPIEESLKDPDLTSEERRKLELSQRVRDFAAKELHLNVGKNYTTFVKLSRPYVTYVVSASPKWELKAYLWSFPFVGKVPYKGFFDEGDAQVEETKIKNEGECSSSPTASVAASTRSVKAQGECFDTYLRGVSAYSTLGWFKDPLTSAMLRYKDHVLVNTIIHESVHATIYLKHEADFNERLAVFLGNKGMELFYKTLEGENSITLEEIHREGEDEKFFSQFMSEKIKFMESWYKGLEVTQRTEEKRQQQFSQISNQYKNDIATKMKTKSYSKLSLDSLNNAKLIMYKTYYQDLSDFEELYLLCGSDFLRFFHTIVGLEKHENPVKGLKELILALKH